MQQKLSASGCQKNRKNIGFQLKPNGNMLHVAEQAHLTSSKEIPNYSDIGFWRKFFDADTDIIRIMLFITKTVKIKHRSPQQLKTNPFGLKNMLGNVMEYCADKYSWMLKKEEPVLKIQLSKRVPSGWFAWRKLYFDASKLRSASRDYKTMHG